MKWLLVVPVDTDLTFLAEKVSEVGGVLDDVEPVPQGSGEQIVYAEGPKDIEARLVRMGVSVKASPSSDFEMFK
ncbi:hypothetical protein [Streptomyces sp. NBC_01443]|uniref:hypothetical protein n=1 Tax=Streptomyces sp. NBC_01443 TaxID=2903868 RepID=UPI00224E96F7|nr:hypothetical protein [Streptomyces sp. NBC_01443]MCX4625472.1 hypothetical protein [Streptomyces sp. NBC_01443]